MRWLGLAVVVGFLTLEGCGAEGGKQKTTDRVEGSYGAVRYAAGTEGKTGAWARFELAVQSAAGAKQAAQAGAASETEPLEVHVIDAERAELTFRGVTLDGNGPLSERELRTLQALEATGLAQDLALIPLELGCTQGDLEPSVLAALLFPWQLMQKYLVADRKTQTLAFAEAASCRYFTSLDGPADERPRAQYPLLTNGQFVARSFGYLPLDREGALAPSVQKDLPTDQNVYGPGDAMCRGACGADCEENNCGEPEQVFRCVKENGRNTGYKQLWFSYTCGEHPGCIEHDACFDDCNATFGVGSWDAGFCKRGCDMQAIAGHGALQGAKWAKGYGPFTHERTYEYSQGDPIYDEASCPLDFTLVAVPASGVAPHATQLTWSFQKSPGGAERCRLDLGDGSPLVTLDPCPENGTYHHIYAVPSEMREPSGVYQATLTRIGSATSASADVQANWVFDASTRSGRAPLSTTFSWLGFTMVDKPLTCTIDFGDGSAPEVLEDCKSKSVSHTYQEKGAYTATLKVTGEDRPVTKTLVIDARGESTEQRKFADVRTWELTYSILTDSTYSWSEGNGAIHYERKQIEREMATLVLTRRSENPWEIILDGTGTASSSLERTFDERSAYHHESRYDRGSGTSQTQVYVTIDPSRGYYDVWITTGEFDIVYGGSRTIDGQTFTYGPVDSTFTVLPAPIVATGELTRKLPDSGLTISGSYTWEDFYAYEQSQDPSFDLEEVLKQSPTTGTTSFTLRPLTFDD
jgi:PKD repeat protein